MKKAKRTTEVLTAAQNMITEFKAQATLVNNQDLYKFIKTFFLRQDVKQTLRSMYNLFEDERRTRKSMETIKSKYNDLFGNGLSNVLNRLSYDQLSNLELFAISINANYENATSYLYQQVSLNLDQR